MNFDAIFKNVKILKIGSVEQKLWKIRQTVGVKTTINNLPEMTKCRYCTIPALYKQTGNDKVPVLYNTSTLCEVYNEFLSIF